MTKYHYISTTDGESGCIRTDHINLDLKISVITYKIIHAILYDLYAYSSYYDVLYTTIQHSRVSGNNFKVFFN